MTISSTLELRDSFSNTIDQIVNAVNYTVTAMEQMRETMEAPINNDAFKSARVAVDNMNSSIRNMEAAVQGSASETNDFTTAVERTETAARETEQASRQLGDSIRETGNEGYNASRGFMSAADSISQMLIAAGGYKILEFIKNSLTEAAGAAIEFESAVTGIYKTVDGSKEQLQGLSDAVRDMSTQMPATTTEIAGVMEATGQLGIATNDVADFSETMINLGEATNLTSDAAASMLAKFANVTQMDPSNYSNLGSAIVDLGNHFATTEADIVNMSSYLASAATLAGFSQTDILGLSAAMSSVGIEAEAGGSAMSKLITKMQVAVETGDGLTEFAQTANMTVQEFSDTFKNNAVGALRSFITGLNDVERNGASASVILQQMDLDDIRLSNTIRALASSNDLMSNAVSTASIAWSENTALANEAEKRYSTLESKLQMTKNSANNLKIAVGDALTPALSKFTDIAKGVLDKLSEFAKNNKAATAGVTAFAGSIGTAVGGLTTAVPVISQATQAFQSLKNSMTMKIATQEGISVAEAAGQAGSQLLGMVGKLGLVAGGISLAIGLTAGLIAAFSNASDEVEDYNGTLEQCRKEINDTTDEYEAVVSMYGDQSEAAKMLSSEIDTLNAQYEKGGGAVADYAARVEAAEKTFRDFKNTYDEQIQAVENSAVSGQIAAAQLEAISNKAVITNSDLDLMSKYADYLNDTFECDIKVNYDTGELTGFDPTNITNMIIAQAEANRKSVAISTYTSSDTQNKYIEQAKQVRSALIEYENAETEYQNYLKIFNDMPGIDPGSAAGQALYGSLADRANKRDSLKNDYENLLNIQNKYKAKMKGLAIAGGVSDSFDEYVSYLDSVAEETDRAGSTVNAFTNELQNSGQTMSEIVSEHKKQLEDGAITEGLKAVSEELMKTAETYDEVYKAAYESFSKQYDIFENAGESYKKTTDEITANQTTVIQSFIDSANSQAEYFNRINESISTLSAISSADIGVSRQEWDEFIDYASQLPQTAGEKGAAAVNAFADAISSGDYGKVKEAVRAWQDNEKAIQDTSNNIAYEVADMKEAMSETEKAVADAITNIGQQAPVAHQKAQSVVDQLAAGISAGCGNLSAQVTAVEGLMARLSSFNVGINIDTSSSDGLKRGYATGTLSAAPGLALVGENGPELINFGGGEVVYTADQTRRILNDRTQSYTPQIQPINVKPPEVIVNIPMINIDLGRKNKKYEATEYYTQDLPPDDDKTIISEDDIKRLTELAEREAVNKIYQPQITNKIELTNNISSDADLDEIVHSLSAKLIDAMAVTAEGVHD